MANGELSDMMKHYLSVKERYKDCLIFYRLGDFYEMFFDDAVCASRELDLTLTGRDCGLENRAPMCGVPYHAVDSYIVKLVEKGYKVAICEQLENPAKAKGMVKRDVVRVITKGTISGEFVDEKKNNFVCSVCKYKDTVGMSWADITTGEFSATEFYGDDCIKQCLAFITKLEIREIISNEEMLLSTKDFREVTRGLVPKFSSYPEWAYGFAAAEKNLLNQLKVKTLSAFAISEKKCALTAAGSLLEYLKDTQMHALGNISTINYLSRERFLQLDNSALRNLEILKNLGNGSKYGSLLWLLDKTSTPMGARLLNSCIISPLYDKAQINYRLDGVEELFESTVVRLAIEEILKQIRDIERLAGKVSDGSILPKDCLSLASSLSAVPALKFRLSGFNSKIINDISGELLDLGNIVNLLENAIEPNNTPATLKDGGFIKKGFNDELDELRNIVDNAKSVVKNMEIRERDRTGIKTLKIHYNRVFGYYIEVTKQFADKVPLEYQRKQTLVNGERFITDELKELEHKILSSGDLAFKLENQIYDKIREVLFGYIEKFKRVSAAVAKLDLIVSFAEVSKSRKYVRPAITEGGALEIKDGRHPVVEVISKERFIPNDVYLDNGDKRTMIITGPNMAGKSTYMRQIALITIMAHVGCFVPAKSACVPLCDRVFTRVGASDNLILDQSTFMVEMIEVASIIRNATKNSLLILDEVGRGTSTYDGLSIAWAVIEHLNNEIGAKTLFATHYHELTELESKISGINNYKIAVKEINGEIVFLRKIMRGGANRSFGIEVAALAGIPESVTSRAKTILKNVEKGEKRVVEDSESAEEEVQPSEIEKILMDVDINALSPMQAFLLVSDLVEKVKK